MPCAPILSSWPKTLRSVICPRAFGGAMWVYRLGPEKAKRILFTGDKINGREAERLGLVLKAVPPSGLDDDVQSFAHRMASDPQNQLMMQKLMINQALYNMGLQTTQMMATVFDGITRHGPEGINFKHRAEAVGWKQAVDERNYRAQFPAVDAARTKCQLTAILGQGQTQAQRSVRRRRRNSTLCSRSPAGTLHLACNRDHIPRPARRSRLLRAQSCPASP